MQYHVAYEAVESPPSTAPYGILDSAMKGTAIRLSENAPAQTLHWGVALVLALGLLTAACAAGEEVPPLERRAQAINETIMCPVCPGESIDQSQNPLAVQMRAIVMGKLEGGWTEQQIRGFLLERYPRSVLLDPPREGANLLVWLVPPIGLVMAGVLLYLALRGMQKSNAEGQDESLEAIRLSEEERAAYVRRIEVSEGWIAPEGEPSDSKVGGAT